MSKHVEDLKGGKSQRLLQDLKSQYKIAKEAEEKATEIMVEIKKTRKAIETFVKAVHFCPVCGNPIDAIKDRRKSFESIRAWQCSRCNTFFVLRFKRDMNTKAVNVV